MSEAARSFKQDTLRAYEEEIRHLRAESARPNPVGRAQRVGRGEAAQWIDDPESSESVAMSLEGPQGPMPADLREGTPCTLSRIDGGGKVAGTIVREAQGPGRPMVVVLRSAFEGAGEGAVLKVDKAWLAEKVASRIVDLSPDEPVAREGGAPEPGEANDPAGIGRALLDGQAMPGAEARPIGEEDLEPALEGANEGQQAAVAKACGREALSVVWGPPGTGKTSTLARIAEAHAEDGRRVLLSAHTHAGVEAMWQALEKRMGNAWMEANAVHWKGKDASRKGAQWKARSAPVVAMTVSRALIENPMGRPDTVVIDEASMLPCALVAAVAAQARERCVVAGDPKQLSPIVATRSREAQQILGQSVFLHRRIAQRALQRRPMEEVAYLNEQYRMRGPIMRVVNALGYRDELALKEAPNEKPEVDRIEGLPDDPIVLLDTSSMRTRVHRPRESWSRYNPVHAAVAVAVARSAANGGRDELAVAAPFTEQVQMISKMGADAIGRAGRLGVSTVHSLQGAERDTIVCDLTETHGIKLSGFARARHDQDEGTRLLTVAASRARSRLVVIADCEVAKRLCPQGGAVRVLIAAAEKQGVKVDAQRWMAGLSPDRAPHVSAGPAAYHAMMEDLRHAKERVDIFCSESPSAAAMEQWRTPLEQAAARGVEVRLALSTTPEGSYRWPPEWSRREAYAKRPRVFIREKEPNNDLREETGNALVVDGKVAWSGNVLEVAVQGRSESVLRTEGERAVPLLRTLAVGRRQAARSARRQAERAAAEQASQALAV